MPSPVVHFEISGRNQAGLKAFYTSVFGWQAEDWPMPGGVYVGVQAKGGGIGGGIGVAPAGTPVSATCYVEVADPQATLERAQALGASVIMPVTDLGMVVIALFADPEGFQIGLVKSDPGQPAHDLGEPEDGAVSWFEVVGADGARLRDFYHGVFGWEMQVMPEYDYAIVDTSGGGGCGVGIGQAPAGHTQQMFYILTADITAKLAQIEAAGGKAIVPETAMGPVVFGVFSDPDGCVIGLLRRSDS